MRQHCVSSSLVHILYLWVKTNTKTSVDLLMDTTNVGSEIMWFTEITLVADAVLLLPGNCTCFSIQHTHDVIVAAAVVKQARWRNVRKDVESSGREHNWMKCEVFFFRYIQCANQARALLVFVDFFVSVTSFILLINLWPWRFVLIPCWLGGFA